jgi:hypothetical protein
MRGEGVTARGVQRWRALASLVATLAGSAGACGGLDNVTNVHDLRVLAVRSVVPSGASCDDNSCASQAGFLVPLDNPSSLTMTTTTLTALVADPLKPSEILTLSGEACPDYIDTVTAASGQSSKLCPGANVTDQLPPPLNQELATTDLPPGTATPGALSTIEYDPTVVYGMTSEQLGLFFSPTSTGNAALDQAIQYNRDFGIDAIVSLDFMLGNETASALKRVVYWPLLPPNLVPPNTACTGVQTPNQNPELQPVGFFGQRVDGIPMDEISDASIATLSIATDQLYVQPTFNEFSEEWYLLRVRNADTGMVETQCRQELLTFQFFATAGTFTPAERTSRLSPLLTPPANGHIPIDAQWKPPSAANLPADGKVTVWIVARDERAGASWKSRVFMVTP